MNAFDKEYPRLGHFIAGEWRYDSSPNALPVVNPATEQILTALPMASAQDVSDALRAVANVNDSWRQTPVVQRADYLKAAARLLRERAQYIGSIITQEQGRPLKEAVDEVRRSAALIEWNAQAAVDLLSENGASNATPDAKAFVTRYVPVGPVAAFTPWNVPVLSPARKISMALAAGCPCIIKPAENTPGSAVEVVRAFADAGLPAGVLNLLTGDPALISRCLVESPVIRKVTFTGSVPIGKLLAKQAGALMKPVTMELGGHNPVLIFEDADIEDAARQAAVSSFRNAGQICTSPTRFYVQEGVYQTFLKVFKEAAESLLLGQGFDPNVRMGPVVNERRLQAISQLVERTVEQGARLVTGGKRVSSPGYFYAPTILTDIAHDSAFMQEEPFGPVVGVFSFVDAAEGIAKCNDSTLGLASYVFTGSPERAQQVGMQLDTGVVGINQFSVSRPDVPFGGVKDSGYGREGGLEGLKAFLVTKTLV